MLTIAMDRAAERARAIASMQWPMCCPEHIKVGIEEHRRLYKRAVLHYQLLQAIALPGEPLFVHLHPAGGAFDPRS